MRVDSAAPSVTIRSQRCAAGFFVAAHVLAVGALLRGVDFSLPFPLLTGDFALYYARALRTVAFESASGRFWGYNPFAMAGYVSGAVHGTGSLLFSLLAWILHAAIPVHRSLLVLEIACLLALPFVVYGFIRCVADRASALAAFGATVIIYGRFGFASPGPFLHGFLPFQVGCFLAFLCGGLFLGWVRGGSLRVFAGFAALLTLVPALNPGTVPLLCLVVVSTAVLSARKMSTSQVSLALAAALTAALLNLTWIRAFVAFRDWIVDVSYFPEISPVYLWHRIGPAQSGWFDTVSGFMNVAALGFAGVGWNRLRVENRTAALATVTWLAGTAIFAFAGSYVGLGSAGPGRYSIPIEVLVLALAGIGAAEVGRVNPKGVLALSLFCVAAAVASDTVDIRAGRRRIENRLFPVQAAVERFVRSDTAGGRTLIEGEIGNAPHFLDLLPSLTGAEILGGSNAGNFLKSRFTVFAAPYPSTHASREYLPTVFGRPLAEQTAERFASYLKLYNVRTILAWSTEAQAELDRFGPILTKGGVTGNHRIYRVVARSSPFLEGSGGVEPRWDGLVVTGASKGRLVLSYHWIKTLATNPPLPMRPRLYLDDPVPFIEIDNAQGASRIEIRNAGL